MRCSAYSKCRDAFTLTELLILVAVLAILTAVLLPALSRPHHCYHPACANNLKQIGLAFKMWALDNGERFPMSVSTNDGGTMELCSGTNVAVHFAVMSNELSTPKLLVCPEDKERTWATNFHSNLNNSKLSYFVGLNSEPANLSLWLSGDRNLTSNCHPTNGILALRPGDKAIWTRELHNAKGNILLVDGSVQMVSNINFHAVPKGTEMN